MENLSYEPFQTLLTSGLTPKRPTKDQDFKLEIRDIRPSKFETMLDQSDEIEWLDFKRLDKILYREGGLGSISSITLSNPISQNPIVYL